MRTSKINRIAKISAIVLAAFIAAVSIPVTASAQTGQAGVAADAVQEIPASPVMNIAKIDYESRTVSENKMIADNEVPLAAAPSGTGLNMTLWWIVVVSSLIITGTVIIESRKIKA